jgi:hypothetical protein
MTGWRDSRSFIRKAMIGGTRSRESGPRYWPYLLASYIWETTMANKKNTPLTACAAFALAALAAAAVTAGARSGMAWQRLSAADPCMTDCKMRADFCREQCAHPEEPEQCIVACSRSECNDSCNKFEDACARHCPNPKS